ncbi:hypothetical protein [Methylobacterium sp. NFXW15]|uniref:hypothetical protein n=1 Tax=Methylobacterium sp. NFXW15 TaxID=2819512 RepID=UPI003CF27996
MAKPRTAGEAMLNVDRVRKFATRQRLLIGIPAEKAERGDGGPNNATLGYIHEYGAPEANIPARPFLMPGMEAAQSMIVDELAKAFAKGISLAAVQGDVSAGKAALTDGLHRAGLKAVSIIQGRITAGLSPPLAERTVYARLHRKKNRRSGSDMKPLIDTGQLLRSISYVIRN